VGRDSCDPMQNRIELDRAGQRKAMRRRDFITATGALLSLATLAQAQTYPSRPVHLIVGFPPGGTTDVVARVIGKRLSERFGVSFVVENMPGAGTNIATAAVVRASADGYTLLVITPSNTINASFYDKLDFDFGRDIRPIATLIRSPYVLEVYPGFPAKTVPELIAYTKANPGKINLASFGTGTASHLSGGNVPNDVGGAIAACSLQRIRANAHRSAGGPAAGCIR